MWIVFALKVTVDAGRRGRGYHHSIGSNPAASNEFFA